MVQTETTLKAWGNSIGVVLPKDLLKGEGLCVDDEVEVVVRKKNNPLRSAYGAALKFGKPLSSKQLDKALNQIDKELDSKFQ